MRGHDWTRKGGRNWKRFDSLDEQPDPQPDPPPPPDPPAPPKAKTEAVANGAVNGATKEAASAASHLEECSAPGCSAASLVPLGYCKKREHRLERPKIEWTKPQRSRDDLPDLPNSVLEPIAMLAHGLKIDKLYVVPHEGGYRVSGRAESKVEVVLFADGLDYRTDGLVIDLDDNGYKVDQYPPAMGKHPRITRDMPTFTQQPLSVLDSPKGVKEAEIGGLLVETAALRAIKKRQPLSVETAMERCVLRATLDHGIALYVRGRIA